VVDEKVERSASVELVPVEAEEPEEEGAIEAEVVAGQAEGKAAGLLGRLRGAEREPGAEG